jgi:threonine/homoserine/homoserine lactone efflux protein
LTGIWSHAGPAFALGFALGAAPGPVQVLILSETARRGFSGGLRVMLGANLTLLAILVVLAFGFSLLAPNDGVVRALRITGGAFLIFLAVQELRTLAAESRGRDPRARKRAMGPALLGIVSVILNPGAWIFFATTASAVVADATTDAGRDAALLAAVAMAAGVSLSDASFTVLGSGGRRVLGERALLWIRVILGVLLGAIGVMFAWQGASG